MPINALKRPFRARFPGKLRNARVADIGMLQIHERRVPDIETNSESVVMAYTSGSPESIRYSARIMPSVMGSSTPSSSPCYSGATRIAGAQLVLVDIGHPLDSGTAADTPNPGKTRKP
jgi:hypothetical protein